MDASLKPVEASDAARRAFLRQFLHDLATPLSAVSLHLEGADRRARKGADPSESLAVARAELSKAFELFELGRELLVAPPREACVFPFDEWVEDTVSGLSENGVVISGATGGLVRADRDAVSEALSALLANALAASPPEQVFVRREREGGRLKVTVENPGRLPGEDPEKLFTPRAAAPGKNWGMGLARARLSVADAGGSLLLNQREERVSASLELPEEGGT